MVECSSGAGAATHTIDGWRAPAAQRWRNAVTAAGTSTARWRAYKAGRIGYAGAVQKSAFPDAYAKWEPEATVLVSAVGSAYWRTIPGDLEQCPVNCPGFVNIDGQSGSDSGCLRGEVVLARAATWLTAWGGGPVPYLSSGDPAVWFRGYRRDCSGYASMALGLAGPGLDGVALAARSMPIRKGAACE